MTWEEWKAELLRLAATPEFEAMFATDPITDWGEACCREEFDDGESPRDVLETNLWYAMQD